MKQWSLSLLKILKEHDVLQSKPLKQDWWENKESQRA